MSRRTRRVSVEDYLEWLEPQLCDEHAQAGKTYGDLLILMYERKFEVSSDIPMDDNRMADGLELRVDFARECHIRPTLMVDLGACSFLEVLIALSRRMAFVGGGTAPGWAWQLLCNLELDRMSDPLRPSKQRRTFEIMDNVIYRRYHPDGTGGFFPLTDPDEDQTQIELWHQLNAYISELHSEH